MISAALPYGYGTLTAVVTGFLSTTLVERKHVLEGSMRKNRLVVSVLITAVLLCTGLPSAAMADSGPVYYSAGVLVPTTSSDIRMTREVLTIDYTDQVGDGPVNVHARFWFKNEGKAVTQQMGFPLGRELLSGFGIWGSQFKVTMERQSRH